MKTTVSSTALKKRIPKGAFQDSAVVFGNIKHSGDEKDISLSKSGSSGSVYSDVESLSGENEDVSMSETNGGFFLGLAATTPKTKRINTGADFGSPLGFPNFHINDDEVVLPSYLPIFLEKKWIDSKIIKTLVKKNFLNNQWFWGATILSKFEEIIRSTFTSEKSIEMATSLARKNKIIVNTNLKKQGVRSDRAVVIKEIPIDTPKKMIVATAAEFGEIRSIKIQLISMWQKAVVEFAITGGFWSLFLNVVTVCWLQIDVF
ncbi:hypothetical protein G9A89_021886 [Geosiphon pyriformis]|nr:hypothetical protein G9A89_021886 [Geosiphon pyriformis]